MRKDYQFLIGQRFSVEGQIYEVQSLTNRDEHTYVQAVVWHEGEIVVGEPQPLEDRLLFSLHDVIQSLLVDEEIELFNPTLWRPADRLVV